jgi:glycosyltransferase involved in cell wall biosynthesis
VASAAVSKNIAAHSKNGAQLSVRPLSADNRVVHGLWIGPSLSKMELLTIQSFIRHGHEFHLWLYDDLNTSLPKEVVIEDATEIIPQNRIMQKADIDPESGVGKGSYSPFSDLFRYKLLYEKGGYWVDMDVTCLRPFNFDTPYLFRAHRVGVVGNIMKCPPRSRLMKNLYEKIGRELNQHSDWLMTNRTLSKMVRRLRLSRYIRSDIWNEELWWEVIRPLMLGDQPIPSQWFAVHWINEFLRTLKESGGIYRGRRLFDVVPDKDSPAPNSALARLYSEYLTPSSLGSNVKNITPAKSQPEAPMNRPAERQPPALKYSTPGHINILIASLARGGAERIVLETLSGLQRRNTPAKLFVLYENRASFAFAPASNVQVLRLHALEPLARLQKVADEVLASPEPVLYTHLIKVEQLLLLWKRGIKTIPVVHNSRDCWQDPPASYNHPNIPFVAAVSDEVAKQLREDGCSRKIVVIRHELQRWSTVEEQQRNRLEIRDRYGIADGTLVIGMVGEFKTQKAYTRAVRVLAQIRQQFPAKLFILGGWDHDWGHGRQAYTATHRLALDLGVVTDLLTPGPMPDAEKYYAAFDVFLNTSAYEGLSVSLLEAIQAGCPIVTADVGGNREVLPERGILVKDSSDIPAYVNGIAQVLKTKSRVIAQKLPDFDLVPKLWSWLAKYNRPDISNPAAGRGGTLFLTDNLNIGGAQRSLINLLGHLPSAFKKWLCVLETTYCQGYLDEVERSGASVFSMHDAGDYLERVERLLCMIELLKVRNVCFWNVDPRIKLLLAKILPAGAVRLTDVSPGPFLFIEMEGTSSFQRRVAFSASDYWARLDHFVAKYAGGIPKNFSIDGSKAVVIPNGVVLPATSEQKIVALADGIDPDLIIGTVCRIMPAKRIDFLIDMMAELNRHLKGAMMIVVGGIDPRYSDYWPQLLDRLNSKQVTNIYFAGPRHEVTPFLRRFKVLVMMSETPGCPNASLEAMALGIPVVANAAGGTDEQVLPGINGFLVSGKNPVEMSRHVRYLLVNHEARKRFGEAAKITAEKDFSMNLMVQRYVRLFENPNPDTPAVRKLSRTRPANPKKLKSTTSRYA